MFRSPYKYPLTLPASQWAKGVNYYHNFREAGIPIVGIRYEDIIADPETNMRCILRHCELPEVSAVNGLRALDVDSQLGTPLSSEGLRRIVVPEYSGDARTEIDAVCQQYGLPPFSRGPYIAPGTVTTEAPHTQDRP